MKKITAPEGKYFTQKNIENESGRAFAITLYLADNDSADNWREATQEEYYAWQKKMAARKRRNINITCQYHE